MHVQRIPKVSIFMAVTTKIVTEKAKKWPKMARFWPKSRYNGRVMAREVLFYQCLQVTRLCAKFGCSQTPRTDSIHKSFIVLRCKWKEPAPLKLVVPQGFYKRCVFFIILPYPYLSFFRLSCQFQTEQIFNIYNCIFPISIFFST